MACNQSQAVANVGMAEIFQNWVGIMRGGGTGDPADIVIWQGRLAGLISQDQRTVDLILVPAWAA